jgi:hypothetical protein
MVCKTKSKVLSPAPAGRFNGFSAPKDLPKGKSAKKEFESPKTFGAKKTVGKKFGKAAKAAGNFGKTY